MPGGATQAAFLDASNSEDSSLYQDLSSNGLSNPEVAANTTYTYTVDVGERSNAPLPQSFMQLNAGGTIVGKITDPAPAGPGDWVLETIVWDSASDPSLVGSDLALYFQTDQQSTAAESQILYTNAAVIFTSDAPEPSTYALAGIALIGLALFRRKFLARSN